ncbi:MAG: class I SAM-dependent RNA methyltransferase [Propioniciclava sp.]
MTYEPGVGDVLGPLRVGAIAHGGHWVARHQGRVYFVRQVLTDEVVTIRVTKLARRHGFAELVDVVEASPHRVPSPCPVADRCGGCDFQHVEPAHQPELKRRVVAEQLQRLAGITWTGSVETVGDVLGWRTRMRYHSGSQGAWGLRRSRSHAVTPLPEEGCRLAVPGLGSPAPDLVTGGTVVGTASPAGVTWTRPGEGILVEEAAAGRRWRVSTDGFWQVHPRAADTLVTAVLDGLAVREGETALDLYCGVGLFAGALVDQGASVIGIEGDKAAVTLARRNVPAARFLAGSVAGSLARVRERQDLVVLDPPRQGAGGEVLGEVLRRGPRAVAYVACDPAALARDLAAAESSGYRVSSIRAFDLFGSTHHVECVAMLNRGSA